MKYTYKDKKTYKLKNKLKILLTILLAVLISTTGYILSKNVFSKLDYEYFNETTSDGINIKVVGERGIIPSNSILKIEKISKEEKENVDASINDVKNNNMNTVESYTYDIKILDSNNNEIEPSEEIQILFTNDLINNKNLDTNIYHTFAENNNLTTEVLKGELEGETITTKTDSFSYYTVEFTYNNLTYSIEGDSEVKLSTILEQVGLEGEVESVIGSNDNLFSFEKRNNEWYVKAHQAFTSQEWMKVTIDGIEYEITVTDATNYTITYQSGSDGHFEGGATTNIVSYSMTVENATKYSHTPNIDDTGLQNGNYANSLNTNDVITIPGATTLTVDIYYNGESVSYDWLSVWAGNYPSYTASSNRTSEGYVTTDMGAPDNNNKFGGSQSGSYTVNGNSLTNMGHCTLTIQGDSVTFGFKSDSGGYGKGYGYYAIISGTGEIRSITSGTYKEPIPNDIDYAFDEWDIDIDTIAADTTVSATYKGPVGYGTYDGVDWKIRANGTLVIGKAGETQSYINNDGRIMSSWPWYGYSSQITGIDFAGPVNGNGSHSGMFYGLTDVTNVTNINRFNTSNVTNMYEMFYRCKNLVDLNLAGFNTSNVTNMYSMFYGCNSLTNLELSNFDTSNVTDMGQMFSGCSGLTSLDLSDFNTSNVIGMYSMFESCTSLASLNLSNFDTSNVIQMLYMFRRCENLTSLYLSSFDTSNVTDMNSMFLGCVKLESLDLSSFDTSNVTTMYEMFQSCNGLTNLDLTGFDTSKVTTMNGMFCSCRSLVNLDLSNFDTSGVTDMDSMFASCNNLTNLNIANFNVANVSNMWAMFSSCNSLISLDLSSFDTSKVTNMDYMFSSSNNLTTIYVSQGWNVGGVAGSYSMFDGCTSLVGEQGTTYTYPDIDPSRAKIDGGNSNPGYLTYKAYNFELMAYAVFDSTDGSLKFFKDDVGKWYDKQSVETKAYYTNIENTKFDIIGEPSWSNKSSLIQSVAFEEVIRPKSTALWFRFCSNLSIIDLEGLDTSNTVDMRLMFAYCSSLTNLDVSGFDTSNVENMRTMFGRCSNLTTIDISNFDTSNVTEMSYMFTDCSGLTSLDLSNFETSSVTMMYSMFEGCSNLTSLDLSNFDTSNVTRMAEMFKNCTNLVNINLTSFDTSNVTSVYSMFEGCSALTTIYVSDDWNITSNTYSTDMFKNCTNLVGQLGTVFDSNAPTDKTRAKVDGGLNDPGYLSYYTEMYAEFDSTTGILRIFRDEPGTYTDKQEIDTKIYYTGLETITGETEPSWQALYGYQGFGIRGYITSVAIEDIFMPQTAYNMFSNCTNLTTISGMENFDTSRVTNMSGMFEFCENLTNLDLSYFDTSNVIDMSRMFTNCEGLTTLDLSSFNTSKVTDMNYMFRDCYNLEILDTSSFDTSKVTDMSYMFSSFGHFIHELDLRHFDTSSVTTMAGMFRWSSDLIYIYLDTWDTSSVEDMNCMFDYCRNLDYLNIESFDTSSVTNMSYLFQGCSNLQIADVSNFNTSNVTNMSYMFSGCKKLREIDTSNFDTVSVTNMDAMFNDCSRITGLDLTSFDTSNVTGMYYMINSCTGIYHLDLSSFDTSQVTDMSGMLLGLTNIYSITFGTDWEFKSNNVLNYAWKRDVDTVLYTAEELAAAYDGSTMAGVYKRYMLLNIVETVQGDLADINKEFNFTVTVLYDNAYINGSYRYIGTRTGNITFTDGRAIFTLKHNETIGIYLLYNSKYSINQENDGYTLSKTNYSGWLKNNTTSTFTDVLTGTTPTGILLDLIPFIILITFSIVGIFLTKRYKYI